MEGVQHNTYDMEWWGANTMTGSLYLGALRAGIKTILVPEKNRKELSEIPKNIRRKLKFIPVSHMDEVLPIAFVEDPTKTDS